MGLGFEFKCRPPNFGPHEDIIPRSPPLSYLSPPPGKAPFARTPFASKLGAGSFETGVKSMAQQRNKGMAGMGGRGKNKAKNRQDMATRRKRKMQPLHA